jgi:hypothetical protein
MAQMRDQGVVEGLWPDVGEHVNFFHLVSNMVMRFVGFFFIGKGFSKGSRQVAHKVAPDTFDKLVLGLLIVVMIKLIFFRIPDPVTIVGSVP